MDFLQEELDEILNIFSQESAEILQSMDKNLLLLEKNPNNSEVAMHLFRDAHSLKGSARMLGFNGIQDIAHKIEDVLGLIREDKLFPKPEILDVISSAIEHIEVLIKKTVEQKEEFTSEDTIGHIKKLEAISQNAGKELRMTDNAPKNEHPIKKEDNKELLANFSKLEDLTIKIIYCYSKAFNEGEIFEFQNMLKYCIELNFTCIKAGEKELLDIASSIMELASESDKENNKNDEILRDLNIKINDFIQAMTKIASKNNLNAQNYYERACKIIPNVAQNETKNEENKLEELKNAEFIELTNKIIETIPLVGKNKHSLAEAKSLVNEILTKLNDDRLEKIFQSALDIILSFEKNPDKIQKDAIDALLEVLNSVLGLMGLKKEIPTEEIQKASIIAQMVRFEAQNPNTKEETQKTIKPLDWVQNIDTTSIKTLRVNSDKLDKLVNQIGNLIVTRIKSRENIGMAKILHDELVELQKSYHKIGYYMKFFEKKYIQEAASKSNIDKFQKKESFLGYNKQLFSFHNSSVERLNSIISTLNFLTKELQENNLKLNSATSEIENMVKTMRILPLSTVFNLFPRMVHNIAKDSGKEIDVLIEGGEVSADKKIIEDIKIPIMHIVRNSIGHGIETPRERERNNKKRTGTILIRASRKESKIIVSIKDDGRGINIEKIKQRAVERGIATQDDINKMSKEQLANFIFYPGFSTGDRVDELSGRGLGLDIVHSKISQLNGRVDVYSEENRGTIVTMELPTTIATIRTFIIKENDRLFAIPAGSIHTVLRLDPSEIKKKDKGNYFIYNGETLPVCSLASILGTEENSYSVDKYTIMVLRAEGITVGLIVQKLIGDEEILNKKLPEPMLRVKNISGITTLANGEMCLLLNVADILSEGKINPKGLNTTKSLTFKDNSKFKILVLDDSVTTRRLIYNILSTNGYNVEVEADAKNALRLVELNNYDLIISDYEMPFMNGLEFVKKIRANNAIKDTKIFVLTSIDDDTLKENFIKEGVLAFIKKGEFNQQTLLLELSKHLHFGA